jgi:hypothetical protein
MGGKTSVLHRVGGGRTHWVLFSPGGCHSPRGPPRRDFGSDGLARNVGLGKVAGNSSVSSKLPLRPLWVTENCQTTLAIRSAIRRP